MTWEHVHHRCAVPDRDQIREVAAGQGSRWVCSTCGARWRLVLNAGRATWFNLGNEDKFWVGEL